MKDNVKLKDLISSMIGGDIENTISAVSKADQLSTLLPLSRLFYGQMVILFDSLLPTIRPDLKNEFKVLRDRYLKKIEVASKTSILWQQLDLDMLHFYDRNLKQLENHYQSCKKIVEALKSYLVLSTDEVGYIFKSLEPFGSSANGLGVAGSCDLDLVLQVTTKAPSEDENETLSRAEITKIFNSLILKFPEKEFEVIKLVLDTRIPVLKLIYTPTKIEVDISINQMSGIYNTSLIKRICEYDPRITPFLLAVKHWAKRRGLCDPLNATLSSYTWVLLAVHFLQNLPYPVLPLLVQGLEEIDDFEDCHIFVEGDDQLCKNNDNIGTLLVKFFEYYASARSDSTILSAVISLRSLLPSALDQTLPAYEPLLKPPLWRMCIEDPIDPSFDAGRKMFHIDGQAFIFTEMRRALDCLVSENCSWTVLCEENLLIPWIGSACELCGSQEHRQDECPQAEEEEFKKLSQALSRFCYTCRSSEHVARDCPYAVCLRCRGSHHHSRCTTKRNKKVASADQECKDTTEDPRNLLVRSGEGKMSFVSALQTNKPLPSELPPISTVDISPWGSSDDILRTVLFWRLEEILQKNLLLHLLSPLPLRFNDSRHWYRSFPSFLLEEVRASLHQSLEKKNFLENTFSVKDFLPSSVKDSTKMVSGYLALRLYNHENLDVKTIIEALELSTLGVLVRKCPDPVSVEGLQESNEYFLVHLVYPLTSEKANNTEKKLMSDHRDCALVKVEFFPVISFVPTGKRELDGFFAEGWTLLNLDVGIFSVMRTCDALTRMEDPPLVMPDVVSGEFNLEAALFSAALRGKLNESGGEVWHNRECCKALNDSQLDAVEKALMVGKDDSCPQIQLIKGPPGTGKTNTLVALLRSLLISGSRVQATAPTNIAVCELARRCLAANILDDKLPSGSALRPANILLVGSGSRLKVESGKDDPLELFLLDNRLERLKKACAYVSENRLQLMIFLQGHISPNTEDVMLTSAELTLEWKKQFGALLGLIDHFTESVQVLREEAPGKIIKDLKLLATPSFASKMGEVKKLKLEDYRLYVESTRNESVEMPPDLKALGLFKELIQCFRSFSSFDHRPVDQMLLLAEAVLVFSTVNVSGRKVLVHAYFDVVVVDEATQLVQAETALVLRRNLGCLILAGDDKQLPSTVLSQHCTRFGFAESLFSRLLALKYPFSLLSVQYRMHPRISHWPRVKFYEGRVEDGENVLTDAYSRDWHTMIPPFSVWDLSSSSKLSLETSLESSFVNEVEAMVVRQLVGRIRSFQTSLTVGIISPYKGQITVLDHLNTFSAQTVSTKSTGPLVAVKVSTIDGFQGQECDIIIFSAVRSNSAKKIGFLKDERRLNVALTRAKLALAVICDVNTLSSNKTWQDLFRHAEEHDSFYSYDGTGNVRSRGGALRGGRVHIPTEIISKALNKWQKSENRLEQFFRTKENDLFAGAPWRMQLSGDLKEATKNLTPRVSKQLVQALVHLAHGEWPKHATSLRGVCDRLNGVVHCYKVLGSLLVWSVDVQRRQGADSNDLVATQHLKVWNFVSSRGNAVDSAVRRVESALASYSAQYLSKCAEQTKVGTVYVPRSWSYTVDTEWHIRTKDQPINGSPTGEEDMERRLDQGPVEKAATLTKFFDLTSDVARLLGTCEDLTSIELPFVMSCEEDSIVRHNGSMLILGRSGTGKTTVILHRMFLHNQYMKSTEDKLDVPCKQLMITASPILCDAIQRSYKTLLSSAEKLSSSDVLKGVETITTDKESLLPTSTALKPTNTRIYKGIIPSFTNCPPTDYPLIITYDRFLRMLDASIVGAPGEPFFQCHSKGVQIDFERFVSHYYRHVSEENTVGLSASAIYTEIISHVKGSLASLFSPDGVMSEEDYLQLAETRQSNLTEPQRRQVYAVFLQYEKRKKQTDPREFDQMDVVRSIYNRLSPNPDSANSSAVGRYNGPHMYGVYIDEVQDLVPAQIALLRFVCNNPRGFVFAGDTAQTIAHGVGFRFQALKDVFFQEILKDYEGSEQEKAKLVPGLRHLSVNFRTHSGVVRLANSVVQLLLHFFPNQIDKLEPEQAQVEGSAPIFVQSSDNLITQLFERGSSNSPCEFGAEQVILVRDEVAKLEVTKKVGSGALVLTVLESKGMEFSDCLVYNFFSSSPLNNDWRVLYSFIDPSQPHFTFDSLKHGAICSELKILYVLLTRAKQQLVIFDEDKLSREPILSYWQQKSLVEVRAMDESIRSLFMQASSPEEWASRGADFFARRQFSNARLCYGRAGDQFSMKVTECDAAEKEQEAVRCEVEAPPTSQRLFLQAADLYLKLDPNVADFQLSAARCKKGGQAFEQAGTIYKSLDEFESAAECFESAKMWIEASKMFNRLDDVTNSIRCCYKVNDFDFALELIKGFFERSTITSESEYFKSSQECVKKALFHYHATKSVNRMMDYLTLLPTVEDQKRFLKRYGYFDELLKMHVAEGNHIEIAKVYAGKREFDTAAQYYLDASQSQDAADCALKAVKKKCLNERFQVESLGSEDVELLRKVRETLSDTRGAAVSSTLEIDFLLSNSDSGSTEYQRKLQLLQQQVNDLGVGVGWSVRLRVLHSLLYNLFFPSTSTLYTEKADSQNKTHQQRTGKGKKWSRSGGKVPEAKSSDGVTKQEALSSFEIKSAQDCETLFHLCNELHKSINEIVPLLHKLTASTKHLLSSRDRQLLMEGLGFFNILPLIDENALLSTSTKLQPLGNEAGVKTVFRLATQGPRSFSVREFAQGAIRFLSTEVSFVCLRSVNLITSHLDSLKSVSFTDLAKSFLPWQVSKKVKDSSSGVEYYTRIRCQVSLRLFHLVELIDEIDENIDVTVLERSLKRFGEQGKKFNLPSLVSSVRIRSCTEIVSTLLPIDAAQEDLQQLTSLRTTEFHLVRRYVQYFSDKSFRQPGVNQNLIARALITAHLSGSASVEADRLLKILATEKQKQRNHARLFYSIENLLIAHTWEGFGDVTTPDDISPADTRMSPLYYALHLGTKALVNNVTHPNGSLHSMMCFKLDAAGRSCFSPHSFLTLVEKYFVWHLLYWKLFENIVVPQSLTEDVMTMSKSAGFVSAVEGFNERNPGSPFMSSISKQHLFSIANVLLKLLTETSEKSIGLNFSGKAETPEMLDLRNSFFHRVVQMIFTFLVNIKKDADRKFSTSVCVAVSKAMKNKISAVGSTPFYLQSILDKLNFKTIQSSVLTLAERTRNPLLLLHWNLTSTDIPRHLRPLKLTKKILTVKSSEMIKQAKFITLETPISTTVGEIGFKSVLQAKTRTREEAEEKETEKEEEEENPEEGVEEMGEAQAAPVAPQKDENAFLLPYYEKFQVKLHAARNRLSGLSTVDLQIRHTERELVQVGFRRWEQFTKLYCEEVCPLLVEIREIFEGVERLKQTLQEKNEGGKKSLVGLLEKIDETIDSIEDLDAGRTILHPSTDVLTKKISQLRSCEQPDLELKICSDFINHLCNSSRDYLNKVKQRSEMIREIGLKGLK